MKTRFGAAITVAAMLAGVGVGGVSAQTTGVTDPPASAADSADSAEVLSMRLLIAAPAFSLADGLVARAAGLFEEEGLDVEYVAYVPNTAQSAMTVVSGDADIVQTGVSGLYGLRAVDRDVVGLTIGASRATVAVTVSPDAAERLAEAGVTPESPLEDRVAALADLTIATTSAGGTQEQQARSLMLEFGVEARDDQFIAVADQAAMAASVRESQVDALITSPPFAIQPVSAGAVIWINGAVDEVPSWRDTIYNLTMTSAEFAEENPEVIARFKRAMAASHELIASDPDAAIEALTEFFPDLDPELLQLSFETVAPAFAGSEPIEANHIKALEQYNLTTDEPLDPETPFDELFLLD